MIKPVTLIEGGRFEDLRGILSFVNDFDFKDVKRFYTILHKSSEPIRAWQGHIKEEKYFYVVRGSFCLAWVAVDDWENPSKDLKAEYKILSDQKSEILYVPAGYANGIKALEDNSELLVFSTLTLEDSLEEKIRFDSSLWLDWQHLDVKKDL